MALNVKLMKRVLDRIAQHPEEHDQDDWVKNTDCGTTFCFAGFALLESGYTVRPREGSSYAMDFYDELGNKIDPSCAAQEKLGLSYHEAEELFYVAETREQVEFVCNQIAIEHGLTMKELDK